MLCFTANRNGISTGIKFWGNTINFNHEQLLLSRALRADRSACKRYPFPFGLIGPSRVLKCTLEHDRSYRLARLLPPEQSDAGSALIMVKVPGIFINYFPSPEFFRLEGKFTTIFTAYRPYRLGSYHGDFNYLVVLPKGNHMMFSQEQGRSGLMRPVYTVSFDGEKAVQTGHRQLQPFEASDILR